MQNEDFKFVLLSNEISYIIGKINHEINKKSNHEINYFYKICYFLSILIKNYLLYFIF
jgi:hypothetical protein